MLHTQLTSAGKNYSKLTLPDVGFFYFKKVVVGGWRGGGILKILEISHYIHSFY